MTAARVARVTESLRRTWALQLSQFQEERLVTQDGRPRHPESVAEVDADIRLMRHLLTLPVGAPIPPTPPPPPPTRP